MPSSVLMTWQLFPDGLLGYKLLASRRTQPREIMIYVLVREAAPDCT